MESQPQNPEFRKIKKIFTQAFKWWFASGPVVPGYFKFNDCSFLIFSGPTVCDGVWCVFRTVDISLAIAVVDSTACATSGKPIVDAGPS